MFTGIIEDLGEVKSLRRLRGDIEIEIFSPKLTPLLKGGDSVSVNGVCLTIIALGKSSFKAYISPETAKKTTFGECRKGDRVNLELPLTFSKFLGGHIVTGHVDGVGTIITKRKTGKSFEVKFKVSKEISRYLIPKGSVAVDGVSLTVVDVTNGTFTVSLIPHTLNSTTLGFKGAGAKVNIEADFIGKYVEKFMAQSKNSQNSLAKFIEGG